MHEEKEWGDNVMGIRVVKVVSFRTVCVLVSRLSVCYSCPRYSREISRPKTLDFVQSPRTKNLFLKLNMYEI